MHLTEKQWHKHSMCTDVLKYHITDERMSSGGLNAPTFSKAQRLKRELNLNINTNPPLLIHIVVCCGGLKK